MSEICGNPGGNRQLAAQRRAHRGASLAHRWAKWCLQGGGVEPPEIRRTPRAAPIAVGRSQMIAFGLARSSSGVGCSLSAASPAAQLVFRGKRRGVRAVQLVGCPKSKWTQK